MSGAIVQTVRAQVLSVNVGAKVGGGPKGDPGGTGESTGAFEQIEAQAFPVGVDRIRTAGRTEPGVGQADYARVDAGPAKPWRTDDIQGAWWEIAEDEVTYEQLGSFSACVQYASETGRPVYFRRPVVVDVSAWTKYTITGQVLRFVGPADGSVIFDGGTASISDPDAAVVTLFDFAGAGAGLVFRGITTRNLSLLQSVDTVTGDIEILDLEGWRHEGALQTPVLVNVTYPGLGYRIKWLNLSDVIGDGGLCGVHIRAPVKAGRVVGFTWNGIRIPNADAYFFSDGRMKASGVGSGLIIGVNDHNAQTLTDVGGIEFDRVLVSDLYDARTIRPGANPANSELEGVRILTPHNQIGSIVCDGIRSIRRYDTSGLYQKMLATTVSSLTLRNCGPFEGAWALKGGWEGATYMDPASSGGIASPRGYDCYFPSVFIENTDGYGGATGWWIGTEVRAGHVKIKGHGGDLEQVDNPGERKSGTGGVVYCASEAKQDLYIEHLELIDSFIAGKSQASLITLQSFRRIFIERISIRGLKVALFSNQTWDGVGALGPVLARLIRIVGSAEAPVEEVNIGRIDVDNGAGVFIDAPGNHPYLGDMVLLSLSKPAGTTLTKIRIGGGKIDASVKIGVQTNAADDAIGLLEIDGLDLSAVATPFDLAKTPTDLQLKRLPGINDVGNMLDPVFNAASGTPWTYGTAWTAAVGGASITKATGTGGVQAQLSQVFPLPPGQMHEIRLSCSGNAGGGSAPMWLCDAAGNDLVQIATIQADRDYIIFARAPARTGAGMLRLKAGSTFKGTISKVSVKPSGL